MFKIETKYLVDEFIKKVNYPNHTKSGDDCRFVYLFKNELSGLYKIGVTDKPKTRLNQIKNQSGMVVELVILIELLPDYDENAYFIESFIHDFFKEKRKFGEWFDLNVRDVIQVKNLFWHIEGEDIQDNVKDVLLKKTLC